jgi:hypothetical protein
MTAAAKTQMKVVLMDERIRTEKMKAHAATDATEYQGLNHIRRARHIEPQAVHSWFRQLR